MNDCIICNGDGKTPLKTKQGEVVPYAWVYCEECYETHDYQPVPTPDDIDFPVSYNTHRALARQHRWGEPSADTPTQAQAEPQVPHEIVHRHSQMGKNEFTLLKQLAGQVKNHQRRLDDMKQAKHSGGYKGIK